MLSTHVGKGQMIFPPYEPGRMEEIGEQVATDFDILGAGWREVTFFSSLFSCFSRCLLLEKRL